MVRVEPIRYQMITAFKERVQIISKVNEIIDTINSGDIGVTIEQVNEIVQDAIADIDLTDYYTKEETDEEFTSVRSSISNIENRFSNFYTKNEIDDEFSLVGSSIESIEDDLTGKQDILTAGSNITIVDNTINAVIPTGSDWVLWESTDTTSFYDEVNGKMLRDVYIIYSDTYAQYYTFYLLKGTNQREIKSFSESLSEQRFITFTSGRLFRDGTNRQIDRHNTSLKDFGNYFSFEFMQLGSLNAPVKTEITLDSQKRLVPGIYFFVR